METVGATSVWTRETAVGEKRDLWSAMKRGFRGRCPRCGEGKLFRAFLKTADHCAKCELDFTPHRADDLPAYLVGNCCGVGGFDCRHDQPSLWVGVEQCQDVPALSLHVLSCWTRVSCNCGAVASPR